MLEESFGVMQREVGSSIRVLNENTTILLGLFQTQLQETKQTRFSVEMTKIRVDQLETKLDAHTALLNEHTRVLGEHTRILDDHTRILDDHTRILGDHTTRFDRLEGMLTQVLARLPEKP